MNLNSIALRLILGCGIVACVAGAASAQRNYGIGVQRDPSKIPGRVAPAPTTTIIPPVCPPQPPWHTPTYNGSPHDFGPTRGALVSGTGLTVNGSYRGNNLNVGLHLGSGHISGGSDGYRDFRGYCPQPVVYYVPRGGAYLWNRGYDSVYNANYGYVRYPTFNSTYATQAPTTQYDQRMIDALANQLGEDFAAKLRDSQKDSEPVQLSALERGQVLLADKRADDAVKELRRHLKNQPDDARATRILAIALIESDKPDDAAAVMRSAYRLDPALAREKIDADSLGIDAKRLRGLVTRMVAFGHKVQSASAWLTVATLMQAEERNDVALQMLARAEKLGLERDAADALQEAMK